MEFRKLDRIYNFLLSENYSELNNFKLDEIECVLRLRFKNNTNLTNKILSNHVRYRHKCIVRPGQSKFKTDLIQKFGGRCAIRKQIKEDI